MPALTSTSALWGQSPLVQQSSAELMSRETALEDNDSVRFVSCLVQEICLPRRQTSSVLTTHHRRHNV